MNHGHARTVLVTGASIAGPTLAYWLARYGFDVTLVERAPTVRTGGYAIDIRGTAIDVNDRMGILPAVRAEHVATRRVTFVNAQGQQVARVNLKDMASGGGDRHVELARGALTLQPGGLAAVDPDDLVGDERCFARSKEHDSVSYLLRPCSAAELFR